MTDYTPNDPVYTPTLTILENTDPVAARGVTNVPLKQLMDNLTVIRGETAGAGDRIGMAEQNILALAMAAELQLNASVDGTAGNIVIEDFAANSGFIIVTGAYDSTNHRAYA